MARQTMDGQDFITTRTLFQTGGETVEEVGTEILMDKGKEVSEEEEEAAVNETQETEPVNDVENKTTESVSCGTEDESSPRGVLEVPVPGSDSDQSSVDDRTSTLAAERGIALDMNYGAVHLKKLFGQIKRRSAMSITNKLIGKGGHAEVYKGFLPDGHVVAVKKITKAEKNEDRVGDFLAELGIIAHIDHPNTAKLIGFSSDGGLHLVLQFSPHGSLGTVLHGSEESLDWNLRYKVALGIAEGLKYLHCDCQRRIIHRDITASNILLSEDYDAQISDFGLAKWLPEKWLHHVVSPIEGTFGYMAPEYFMHGIVHEKTDVFAFGVLLLELITGRRAVDSSQQSLVMWAKPLLEQNNIKEVADPRLGENYSVIEMKRAMFAAFICIHHLPNMRPNMPRVVKVLKGEHEPLDLKNKQKSMGMKALLWESCDLEDYTSTTYLNDLNRHKELIME
ncbi:UNVERIFIED_CONTAM: Receptor-like cytosolic serine/threonine-protein kinase RBK1 [Sesamum calycinum]|uniref:non-specific serine/threonine protein kinase n=1 Tax=Sesamum calycinum TaxID=2727403 RepID=A0AAW2SWL8_9LAMI